MGLGLELNYYALMLAILKPYSVDQTFEILEKGKITGRNYSLTDQDVENMIKLKSKGYTHKQIGQMYNLSDVAVFKRIKRYIEKKYAMKGEIII